MMVGVTPSPELIGTTTPGIVMNARNFSITQLRLVDGWYEIALSGVFRS